MAGFLTELARELGVPAIAVGQQQPIVSDPEFTHWVVEQDVLVGEAHSVKQGANGMSFAFVRLFSIPEMAEYGYIETNKLSAKADCAHS